MKKFGLFTGTPELSRAVRRILVLVMYGVYFELIVYWNSPNVVRGSQISIPISIGGWLTLAGFIVFAVSYLVLRRSVGGLAERFTISPTRRASLDERQILLRNRAYFWAYLIIGVAVFFFSSATNNLGYRWTLFAFIGFYVSLPTALVAWLEPDPLQDEAVVSEATPHAT